MMSVICYIVFIICSTYCTYCFFFFFQAEDGIRDFHVTGVQTCALPICRRIGAMTMTQPAVGAGEVCRLTLHGPVSRIALAVPAHVPLADLLPTFLGHLGPEPSNAGLAHGGWVLQRLGEPPLAEDLSTAALGLYDGDSLYLRPRDDQLPPADFDDLVDGVATGIGERRDRWRPELTRRCCLGLVGLALALALLLAPTTGPGGSVAVAAAAVAVLLLAGAAAASRAVGDAAAGVLLAGGAVGFAAVAGLALPEPGRWLFDGPGPLTAPGRPAVGGAKPGFLAAAGCGVLAGIAGLLCSQAHLAPAGAAAVVLTVTLVAGVLVPLVAGRLAGLRIAPLPGTQEEFQLDIDPEPGRQVLEHAARADGYMTALFLGLGAVAAGCLAVLAWTPGWAAPTLVAVASALLALHARELRSVRQRLATLVPGVAGAAMLVAARGAAGGAGLRLVALGGLVAPAGCPAAGCCRTGGAPPTWPTSCSPSRSSRWRWRRSTCTPGSGPGGPEAGAGSRGPFPTSPPYPRGSPSQ